MFKKGKLSTYILISTLLHLLIAVALSRIWAEQSSKPRGLRIVSSVRIEYKKPQPPPKPKPKIVAKSQPTKKKAKPKKPKPKVSAPKVEPQKVTRRSRRINAPAPGLALERAPQRSRSAPGIAGLKGQYGLPGDRPGMVASGGIDKPKLTTKVGGSGLSPAITHGSMKILEGTGSLPGFRTGISRLGTGTGRVDIAGRGGSGGTRGKELEGPGAGSSPMGRIDRIGGGKGTTGLGVGSTSGMGDVESEPGGRGSGGEGAGPGTGGTGLVEARRGPGLESGGHGKTGSGKELPGKKQIPEEKRKGATGKKEFKAKVKKDMSASTEPIKKPASRGYESALQGEINRHLHTLRRMHEDWQNRKIPGIPKTLQLTVDLDLQKGKVKLLKVDFHNPSLPAEIKSDLTERIRGWKFRSLYDGKDDPQKWPIRLAGKISWQ